jgi:GLPGLI family protein
VTVISGSDQPGIADAFDGASQVYYFRGNMVRSEFGSLLRMQTIIFNGRVPEATLLRETGNDKYLIKMNQSQWKHFNARYDGIVYNETTERKTIQGFDCLKTVGKLKDGTDLVVWYATDLVPYEKGYKPEFAGLPGMPLEYEATSGKVTVRYTAHSIQFAPVSASKFELPKAGFKMLEYKQ